MRFIHGLSEVAVTEFLEPFQNEPFLFEEAKVEVPYVGLELDPEGDMDRLFTMRSYSGLSVGMQPQMMIK